MALFLTFVSDKLVPFSWNRYSNIIATEADNKCNTARSVSSIFSILDIHTYTKTMKKKECISFVRINLFLASNDISKITKQNNDF